MPLCARIWVVPQGKSTQMRHHQCKTNQGGHPGGALLRRCFVPDRDGGAVVL